MLPASIENQYSKNFFSFFLLFLFQNFEVMIKKKYEKFKCIGIG